MFAVPPQFTSTLRRLPLRAAYAVLADNGRKPLQPTCGGRSVQSSRDVFAHALLCSARTNRRFSEKNKARLLVLGHRIYAIIALSFTLCQPKTAIFSILFIK